MEEILLGVLIGLVLAGAVFYFLWKRINSRITSVEDQVTEMKYVMVEKQEDGSYTFKDRNGNDIFEL